MLKLVDKILGYGEIKGPTFLKDLNLDMNHHIVALNDLYNKVDPDSKEKIDKELMNIKYGLSGEKNVYYELNNSRLPIICLHDIRLEHKGLSAQIDFIVIASEFILVIETKKMYGNIKIDSEGSFIREYRVNDRFYKEGIYSPITQNDKHIELLFDFLRFNKLIKHCPMYSRVVIANEKTIIDKKFAPKEIKVQIIKHDQLIKTLRDLSEASTTVKMPHKHMIKIANTILEHDKPLDFDFVNKLGLIFMDKQVESPIINDNFKTIGSTDETIKNDSLDDIEIVNKLKQYRYKKARELNIKPYYIFNNAEMETLIKERPFDKESFISLHGFGEKKYDLYGEDILKILNS